MTEIFPMIPEAPATSTDSAFYHELWHLTEQGYLTCVVVPERTVALQWLIENHVEQIIRLTGSTVGLVIRPFVSTVFYAHEAYLVAMEGLSVSRADVEAWNKEYYWFGSKDTAMLFKLTFPAP